MTAAGHVQRAPVADAAPAGRTGLGSGSRHDRGQAMAVPGVITRSTAGLLGGSPGAPGAAEMAPRSVLRRTQATLSGGFAESSAADGMAGTAEFAGTPPPLFLHPRSGAV